MDDRDQRWAWAAFAVALLGAAFAVLDFSFWHPGVDAWDQVKGVALAQEAREGWALPWRFGGSNFYFLGLEASLAWGGRHAALWRLPNLLAYAAESALLWAIARRFADAPTAFGAILFNSVAALTWVRLRAILGFSLTPAEVLGLLWLAQGSDRWRSLALGLGLGLVLFEYEAAVIALPVTALWAWSQPKEERPAMGWALLGLGVVLPFVILGTRSSAANFAAVRLAPEAGRGIGALFATGLNELWRFVSGLGREDLLLEKLPALPRFSRAFLVIGLFAAWRQQRALLGWLALGLAPLALHANVAEAHRAIVAWPALCLIGGMGFALAWRWLWASRAAIAALLLALAMAAAIEMRDYRAMQERITPLARSHWRLLEQAAEFLRTRDRPGPVLVGFGRRDVSELRALVPIAPAATGELWALVGRDYGAAWSPASRRILLQDPLSERSAWLISPPQGSGSGLLELEEDLRRFRTEAAPRFDTPGLLAAIPPALQGPFGRSPLSRQALVDTYLYAAIDAGQPPSTWLPFLLAQPALSSTQSAMAAAALAPLDPKRALALAQRSQSLDPRPQTEALIQSIQTQLQARP